MIQPLADDFYLVLTQCRYQKSATGIAKHKKCLRNSNHCFEDSEKKYIRILPTSNRMVY